MDKPSVVRAEPTPIVPEAVSFACAGRMLKGYLYLPRRAGPSGCVIDLHGSGTAPGGADVSRPQTAQAILGFGLAYFFPHRAGYGNSPGTPLWTEVDIARGDPGHDTQLIRRLAAEAADVDAAIGFAAGRTEVDAGRIAIMGNSLGGVHALLAAARGAPIRCAIDFAGGANQWKDYPAFRALLLDAAAKAQVPVFLGQAENDASIAPTQEIAARLKAAGQRHEAHVYPAWGHHVMEAHLFQQTGAAVWGPDVRAFLERYLR